MKRAVVAAEAVPQRDDAQRADLVTAGTGQDHRRPRLAVERLSADGALEVQLQVRLAADDGVVILPQALDSTVFTTRRSVCGCGRTH